MATVSHASLLGSEKHVTRTGENGVLEPTSKNITGTYNLQKSIPEHIHV